MTIKNEFVKFKDAPESWRGRCSADGWDSYLNKDGKRFYEDGIPINKGYRPCKNCGEFPTIEGHDACLGTLGNVTNACCGHGKNKGYISFDNGITVRGKFEIIYNEKKDHQKKSMDELNDLSNEQLFMKLMSIGLTKEQYIIALKIKNSI